MKNYSKNKSNKAAVDTNVLVYANQNEDLIVKNISIDILKIKNLHISHFAFFELLHVLNKKKKINKIESLAFGNEILALIKMTNCTKEVYQLAHFVIKKYDCSLPDSIIIADAILNDCDLLYSRDLQHNQIFEKKTRIINPYK